MVELAVGCAPVLCHFGQLGVAAWVALVFAWRILIPPSPLPPAVLLLVAFALGGRWPLCPIPIPPHLLHLQAWAGSAGSAVAAALATALPASPA